MGQRSKWLNKQINFISQYKERQIEMSETTAETKAAPKPAKKVNNFTGGAPTQGQ